MFNSDKFSDLTVDRINELWSGIDGVEIKDALDEFSKRIYQSAPFKSLRAYVPLAFVSGDLPLLIAVIGTALQIGLEMGLKARETQTPETPIDETELKRILNQIEDNLKGN